MRQRVLIDSGVLAAAVIVEVGQAAELFDEGLRNGSNFDLYVAAGAIPRAKETIKEIPDVDQNRADAFFNALPMKANIVRTEVATPKQSLSRNATETLAAADSCDPHLIVSGDSTIIALKEYKGAGIYHPRDFLDVVRD